LDNKYEVVIFQDFESLKYPGQSECHIDIAIFDHYTNNNDVDSFSFEVQSNLSTIYPPPPESLKIFFTSSTLFIVPKYVW